LSEQNRNYRFPKTGTSSFSNQLAVRDIGTQNWNLQFPKTGTSGFATA
jgi:hypothetical protein